jgi:TrmH family RNA methyltransferase
MKQITSVQNPYIKSLLQLQEKAKARRESGTFLIEGKREIELAVKGGYEIEMLLFTPDLFNFQISRFSNFQIEIIEISREVYQKLAYRDTTEGVLAVAKSKSHLLGDLKLSANPLILIAESIEKPGNVGALLRTADAANVDAVIIADPKSDLYNPNTIRSSVGCLFTRQIAMASTHEAIDFLKSNGIDFYGATLQDATVYDQHDFTKPTAIVVGAEATGLTTPWRDASAANILIPMQGEIDSMNVSVAAAVLVFEAKRQRKLKV